MNYLQELLAKIKSAIHPQIPHVLHQIWHDENVPSEFDAFRESWMIHHPQWTHKLWNFSNGAALLSEHYPELLRSFYSFPKDVQRADMLRYVILHHEGGVYADMDTESLRPLNPLLAASDFVAGYEVKTYPSLCNAIFASSKGHPILDAMLKQFAHAPIDRTDPACGDVSHVFATTGSLVFTPLALAHLTNRTLLLPPKAFYPFSWAQKDQCRKDFPESFCKHYWVSGWYEEGCYHVSGYWNTGIGYV